MRTAQWAEPVSVLDRILAILEAVRECRGAATVTHISRATGIPKSTASRLVGDLVRQQYLVRTPSGVAIGLRLFGLGARASTPRRLGAAAAPVLSELFDATGEHLNVAVREGSYMVSVISRRGRLRPAPSRAGVRVPSATTALGKAVLAFTRDESVLRAITASLDSQARRALLRELDDVRESSVAIDSGNTFPGVVGVASPVLFSDRPIAAISVAGPVGDMDPDEVAPLVRQAARALTRRLAGRAA